MKTMLARYPGYCAQTGARILPGDTIDYHGRGRSILRARASVNSDTGAARPDLDAPEIRPTDVSVFGVSDRYVIGGRDYYRNKRGRCEDAPCCGCCTI
jgi:hypothetical protein